MRGRKRERERVRVRKAQNAGGNEKRQLRYRCCCFAEEWHSQSKRNSKSVWNWYTEQKKNKRNKAQNDEKYNWGKAEYKWRKTTIEWQKSVLFEATFIELHSVNLTIFFTKYFIIMNFIISKAFKHIIINDVLGQQQKHKQTNNNFKMFTNNYPKKKHTIEEKINLKKCKKKLANKNLMWLHKKKS